MIVPYNPFPVIIKTILDNWPYYLIFFTVLGLIVRRWWIEDRNEYPAKRGRK